MKKVQCEKSPGLFVAGGARGCVREGAGKERRGAPRGGVKERAASFTHKLV